MIYHDGNHDLRGLEREVARTCENLGPHLQEFDSIVVTGMSGVVVGAPVSLALCKPLVILRKNTDDAHGAYRRWVNRGEFGARTLWLDDFIATGDTFRNIEAALAEFCNGSLNPGRCEIVARYLYRDHMLCRYLGGGKWRAADWGVSKKDRQ